MLRISEKKTGDTLASLSFRLFEHTNRCSVDLREPSHRRFASDMGLLSGSSLKPVEDFRISAEVV